MMRESKGNDAHNNMETDAAILILGAHKHKHTQHGLSKRLTSLRLLHKWLDFGAAYLERSTGLDRTILKPDTIFLCDE